MDKNIRIQLIGLPERDLLTEMYDRFDPLGAAFGLPPPKAEARRDWVGAALTHEMNLAAFSPAGPVAGHCFLVPDGPGSAELALFVHQEYRRRGIGAGLINAALELAGAAGLRRVWTLTSFDNRPAIRLQARCGFRQKGPISLETKLEIDVPYRLRRQRELIAIAS
jgi:GNAT superfamily N-acetyltransferase